MSGREKMVRKNKICKDILFYYEFRRERIRLEGFQVNQVRHKSGFQISGVYVISGVFLQ